MNARQRKEEFDGGHVLYLGDCLEVMPTLEKVDAVVTDPPYGIGEAACANKSRGNLAIAKDYGVASWDNQTADDAVNMAILLAKHSIVFGGNYYSLPPNSCWLVWDKLNGGNDFADCELAWTNLPKAVRRMQYRWNGMSRQNNEPRGDHPTQKPVGVMRWCLSFVPTAQTILDPFMGSGTTGVACVKEGRVFTGIEMEEKYFDSACRRMEQALKVQETVLPGFEPTKPVQEALL